MSKSHWVEAEDRWMNMNLWEKMEALDPEMHVDLFQQWMEQLRDLDYAVYRLIDFKFRDWMDSKYAEDWIQQEVEDMESRNE